MNLCRTYLLLPQDEKETFTWGRAGQAACTPRVAQPVGLGLHLALGPKSHLSTEWHSPSLGDSLKSSLEGVVEWPPNWSPLARISGGPEYPPWLLCCPWAVRNVQ